MQWWGEELEPGADQPLWGSSGMKKHIHTSTVHVSRTTTNLGVVRGLADVVADGELEGLVLVLLTGGNDPRRVEELQVLLRL